ncbi:MAG: V-type ATP synthase subunit D [Fibrobacterota bacterium]
MALNFQYNKTFLHQLGRDLKVRQNALPTLLAKESALRLEVKLARTELQNTERALDGLLAGLASMERLWPEFDFGLVAVEAIVRGGRKIAGVKVPFLDTIRFQEKPFSLFNAPAWFPRGADALKRVLTLRVSRALASEKLRILERARKKTTQKVNLYEKVQIPEYQNAIRRIKRFLEDEDTLAKSSQKILKTRLVSGEAA